MGERSRVTRVYRVSHACVTCVIRVCPHLHARKRTVLGADSEGVMTKKRARKENVSSGLDFIRARCEFDLYLYALAEDNARAVFEKFEKRSDKSAFCADFELNALRFAPAPLKSIDVFKKIVPCKIAAVDISKGEELRRALEFLASRNREEVNKGLVVPSSDQGIKFPTYVRVEEVLNVCKLDEATLSADDVVELYCRASSANNVEFMRAMETSVHAETLRSELEKIYRNVDVSSEGKIDSFRRDTPLGLAINFGHIEALQVILDGQLVKVPDDKLQAVSQAFFEATKCDCVPGLQRVVLMLLDAMNQ